MRDDQAWTLVYVLCAEVVHKGLPLLFFVCLFLLLKSLIVRWFPPPSSRSTNSVTMGNLKASCCSNRFITNLITDLGRCLVHLAFSNPCLSMLTQTHSACMKCLCEATFHSETWFSCVVMNTVSCFTLKLNVVACCYLFYRKQFTSVFSGYSFSSVHQKAAPHRNRPGHYYSDPALSNGNWRIVKLMTNSYKIDH